MADENGVSIEGTSAENEGLEDHIAHWIEVLDRWVKGVDLGVGRHDGDPESPAGGTDVVGGGG